MDNLQTIETQKRLINAIATNSKEAIIITDPNTLVTHFNKTAQKITGFGSVDTINKPVGNFLNIEDHKNKIDPAVYCPSSEIDVNGTVYNGKNVILISKTNEKKVVNLKSVKVNQGMQIGVGCIIFIENTFEQMEFERMKKDFVGLAEHILRTPITIIRGYLSRMMEPETANKLNEQELNYLNTSFSAAANLLSLVEDLFNISDIHKDTFKMKMVDVSIEDLIAKVVAEFRVIASEKNVRINYVPPIYKLPMIKVDILKMQMVLNNLLENAVRFTEEGSIGVSLGKTENGKFVIVKIQDDGYGVPEKNLPYIFEKFYQVKDGLEMRRGLGLGLYIAKKLVNAHGGEIWAESKEGEGSTFSFTLPFAV